MPVTRSRRPTDWTEEELVIAVYLYRFGWEDLGVTYSDIAKLMRRKPSTIPYRLANFLSFEGAKSGLKHGGPFAKSIYEAHRDMPKDALRRKAIHALLVLSGGRTDHS